MLNPELQNNLKLKYAKQFKITYTDTSKKITIVKPWSGSNKQFNYYLSDKKISDHIQTPVNSVICLSPTPFAMLNLLNLTDKISAIGTKTEMYNTSLNKFKSITSNESGNAIDQNFEKLIALAPELIFESATGSAYDNFEKLEELNLKTALFSAHTEPHPLGRAEWLKYIAAFFNYEKQAEVTFNSIEQRYITVHKTVKPSISKPKIFIGYPWKNSWIVPGGNSYMAKFIYDAGGDYCYAADTSSGNLYISFEKVLELLPDCDIWLNPGVAVVDKHDLEKVAVINKSITAKLKIYNNNKRLNAYGKNDFWESGIVNPDVILKDLVRIIHPSLLMDHNLYYYRAIKE